VAIGVDSNLHGRRINNVVLASVMTNKRFDPCRAATEGNTGGGTILDHDETLVSVCIKHGMFNTDRDKCLIVVKSGTTTGVTLSGWVPQLAILDKAPKLQSHQTL